MNTKENRACNIYAFLNAAQGNWRNSIFIECEECMGINNHCAGMLLVPNFNGLPVFMPVGMIYKMTGELIDKNECVASMSREKLEKLYALYLGWKIDDPNHCIFVQILDNERLCHDCKYQCCYPKENMNRR